MCVRFGVISDDFTGANDTGVQFEKSAMETSVLTGVADLPGGVQRSQVLVIDTESRHDSHSLAYKKARQAAETFKTMGVKIIYKKIDSTLRGNIGSELDAIMDELGIRISIVAPAYPKNRRTTMKGHQIIGRVPETMPGSAEQSSSPAKNCYVPAVIQSQSHRRVGQIDLPTVREGVESLKHAIWSQNECGNEIVVIDAVNQIDLRIIAEAVVEDDILACGSAGLAEELAAAYGSLKTRPVLLISGSLNQVTARQVSRAKEVLDVAIVELDVQAILEKRVAEREAINRIVKEVTGWLKQEKDVVVRSKPEKHATQNQRIREVSEMNSTRVRSTVLPVLGKALSRVAENYELAGLVLVGGDTAIEVIRMMKASGIKIGEEIAPGIPSSEIIGGIHEGLRIVTKAGGFGTEDALILAIDYLKRRG